MSVFLEIAEGLIAGGTLAAAWFAKASADASARVMQAQVYSDLMQSYDQDVMSNALRELGKWHEGRAVDFDTAINDWATEQVSARPSSACLERDRQRRLVSHFFHKASLLVEENMVQAGLKNEILALFGKQIMRDVVLPMDRALHIAQGSPSKNAMELEKRFLKVFFPGQPRRLTSA